MPRGQCQRVDSVTHAIPICIGQGPIRYRDPSLGLLEWLALGARHPERRVIRAIVDDGFVFAFRVVMIGAAGMALVAAAFGNAIRHHDIER